MHSCTPNLTTITCFFQAGAGLVCLATWLIHYKSGSNAMHHHHHRRDCGRHHRHSSQDWVILFNPWHLRLSCIDKFSNIVCVLPFFSKHFTLEYLDTLVHHLSECGQSSIPFSHCDAQNSLTIWNLLCSAPYSRSTPKFLHSRYFSTSTHSIHTTPNKCIKRFSILRSTLLFQTSFFLFVPASFPITILFFISR